MIHTPTSVSSRAPTALDVERVRRDFPILTRVVHGRPLVYLDSAASSQRPLAVIDAVRHYDQTSHANIHRGVYVLSEEATAAYEHAHVRVAQLEHHSNLVPWQQIARRTGARVQYIRVDGQGHLDMEHAASVIGPRTKMVAVAHVSNVLGTVNPVHEFSQMAHAQGALLCVDGAQSIPHMPVDVRALDCDFFAFSGHKMLGPTGIGGLYGKRHILEHLEPFLYGGDMIREVTFEGASWNDLPWKFEAGTPPIAQGIGLAAAVEYLQRLGMEAVQAHEQDLVRYALEQMRQVHSRRTSLCYAPDAGAGHQRDLPREFLCLYYRGRDRCVDRGHWCSQEGSTAVSYEGKRGKPLPSTRSLSEKCQSLHFLVVEKPLPGHRSLILGHSERSNFHPD